MMLERIRTGVLSVRFPSPEAAFTPQFKFVEASGDDPPTTIRHQTRYWFSYTWPSAWQRGETPNKRARSGFALVLPNHGPAGLPTNCRFGFWWTGTPQLASASKTFLYLCRSNPVPANPHGSDAQAGSKGQSLTNCLRARQKKGGVSL
jgi:hypothetical protein